MRILRVIPSMDPQAGGPPQGIRNLLPALEATGIDQDIICLDEPVSGYLDTETLPIRTLGPAKTAWAYTKNLPPWLRANLSDFDAVLCHGLWQYPLLAVRKEIERLRRVGKAPRFYVYPHGMLDPWFQKDPSRRLKAWRNEVYWHLFERRNLHAADAVLFTCEEERRLAATTFPGYRVKEEVVGYGIPSPPHGTLVMKETFRRLVPALPEGQPYFLFLSRIHPKKGVDLLIRAYADLIRRTERGAGRELQALGSPPPALVIAGPLDSDYAKEIQRLAAELFLSSPSAPRIPDPSIHFPGMLQGDSKWGALYGAEAFILPSHQENFGIAVVEALACGTPVLISDKVNIWREIVDAGGGLVENDDQAGALQLLSRWMELSPDDQTKASSMARNCYETHFSIGQAADRLVDFLRKNIST